MLEEGVGGRPYPLAVDDEHGDVAWPGAGGDDDVAPVVPGGGAVPVPHLHGAASGQPSVALDVRHLVLLEEMADAARQTSCDAPAALLRRSQVDLHVSQPDAVLPRLLELGNQERAGQERLGGDAAHVQTHPAQLLVLHAGGAQPELRSADGGNVASRAAADDDHVEILSGVDHLITSDVVR